MKQTVLFVDAGHGGYDKAQNKNFTFPQDGKMTKHTNGAAYHDGNGMFYEGESNRNLALEFISQASKAGFLCFPTFSPFEDTWRSYNYSNPKNVFWQDGSRCDISNTMWEKLGKPQALLLSFHSNAVAVGTAPQTSAGGACAFVYNLQSNTAKLAEAIMKPVENVFTAFGSSKRAQLVHADKLDMTSHTKMPAILLEMGFFDNPQNANLLIQPEFLRAICTPIVSVLNNSLK